MLVKVVLPYAFLHLYLIHKAKSITDGRKKLRAEMEELVNKMTQEQKDQENKAIREKLFKLPQYKNAKRVGTYLSRPEQVDTDEIIKKMVEEDKKVFIPKQIPVDAIDMVLINGTSDLTDLELNMRGFRAPNVRDRRLEALSNGGLDLLLIPGFAFSKDGCRIGGRKGFFDRYVKRARVFCKNITVVGLAWKHQIVDSIPDFDKSLHFPDIKVDIVLYP